MILNSAFQRIHHYVVVFESYGDIIKTQERVACNSNSLHYHEVNDIEIFILLEFYSSSMKLLVI